MLIRCSILIPAQLTIPSIGRTLELENYKQTLAYKSSMTIIFIAQWVSTVNWTWTKEKLDFWRKEKTFWEKKSHLDGEHQTNCRLHILLQWAGSNWQYCTCKLGTWAIHHTMQTIYHHVSWVVVHCCTLSLCYLGADDHHRNPNIKMNIEQR